MLQFEFVLSAEFYHLSMLNGVDQKNLCQLTEEDWQQIESALKDCED